MNIKRILPVLASIFLLSGCATSGVSNSTGGLNKFSNHHFNEIPVIFDGEKHIARAENGKCSNIDFGVGNGETGCITGTKHSMLMENIQGVRGGKDVEYGFEFFIPKEVSEWSYGGKMIPEISKFTNEFRFWNDSAVELAVWQRIGAPKVANLIVKVHPKIGVYVLDKVCIPPEQFGTWVKFKMKTNFSKNGILQVECNDIDIINEKQIDMSVNPFCYIQNDCDAAQHKRNSHAPIRMYVGLRVKGIGTGIGRPNKPVLLPENGLEVHIRNLYTKSN